MASFLGSYDVAVVGGGPVGSVAAAAFARQGARVAMLEANPGAKDRFAGEWIHPSGVAVLDAIRAGHLDPAAPRTGYGFVIVANDGGSAIEMPYPAGTALSTEHGRLVEALRTFARSLSGVDYFAHVRVTAMDGPRILAEDKKKDREVQIEARRIVGADGRASVVRRALGLSDASQLVSYMASVELHDAELPFEGYGHVVLGGPGPALLYRIADGRVRGCLDVPLELGGEARTPEFLRKGFEPVLPPSLSRAFRRALERSAPAWAANRFRPRGVFGHDRIALVGDAVGHVHPMTAIGLSMGFMDALELARLDDVAAYAKARSGHVPELLANALYHCFRRPDPSARALRQATIDALRASERERRHTMRILACEDDSVLSFARVCLRMTAGALGIGLNHHAGQLSDLPASLGAYAEWLKWPAAALCPTPLRKRYRANSNVFDPIPGLGSVSAPPPAARLKSTPPPSSNARTTQSVAAAIRFGTELLLRELESLAMQYGHVPDEELAAPGMHMMRAVTSTEMRPGIAARMTIGRRRLAMEGIPRLLGLTEGRVTSAFAVSDLAELLLVFAGGTAWAVSPIAGLDQGMDALLDAQTERGGFVPRALVPSVGEDLATTSIACRALSTLLPYSSAKLAKRIEAALGKARAWLSSAQLADGSFAGSSDQTSVSATAWAIEALVASGESLSDSSLVSASNWLRAQQSHDGTWSEALADPRLARRTDARAARALIAASDAVSAEVESAIARLADALNQDLPTGGAASALDAWEECWEIVETLAAYLRKQATLGRPENRSIRAHTRRDEQDWAFCCDSLEKVSRTFSRPIAFLPERLRRVVTVSYLLCRVADTIEDHPNVPAQMRDRMFALLLETLDGQNEPDVLVEIFERVPGDDAELALGRNLPTVLRVLHRQSQQEQAICARWVSEMARGMCLYTHRQPAADGVIALHTLGDLERYCYFVAGTVGHLLTDLFLGELAEEATPEIALGLRHHAESFGSGLQLVNILKDLTDDHARRHSYVPRTACAAIGLGIEDLTDPARRAEARAAVRPVFDVARRHLDDGLTYSLLIPKGQRGIRLFCLLPLWMAVRTLVAAQDGDAMFAPNTPVKITRQEVESLTAECIRLHADDSALRERYAALWLEPAHLARRSAG